MEKVIKDVTKKLEKVEVKHIRSFDKSCADYVKQLKKLLEKNFKMKFKAEKLDTTTAGDHTVQCRFTTEAKNDGKVSGVIYFSVACVRFNYAVVGEDGTCVAVSNMNREDFINTLTKLYSVRGSKKSGKGKKK